MRIINKKYLLITLLVGVLLTGVIILKPAKEVKLDNVILKQEVNSKTFAMYKEEGKSYVPVEGTEFPKMYVLNLTESKCIDNNGNELNGVLSYENDKVTITSGNTTYCYLYFDKSLGLEIKEKKPNKLSADIKGAMYRFQGQQDENVNNYICFGTSDTGTCTTNPDKNMYRIIGIEAETGRVKVIKMKALKEAIRWWEDYNTDVTWPNSLIFKAINNEDFLNNTSYIPTDWKEKIANNSWIYGDMLEDSDLGAKQLGAGLYETESGKKSTSWYVKSTPEEGGSPYVVKWKDNTESYGETLYYKEESGLWNDRIDSKISLMNLSDYSYSVGDEANCTNYKGEEEYGKCKLGWMHLSQNDKEVPNGAEWTMSRNGWNCWNGAYVGFAVASSGFTAPGFVVWDSLSIRPVFYIDASQSLKDGLGTIDNPYIIQ